MARFKRNYILIRIKGNVLNTLSDFYGQSHFENKSFENTFIPNFDYQIAKISIGFGTIDSSDK